MHELSLAERLIDMIEEAGARQGFRRVRHIYLEVGTLAGVEVESLRLGLSAAGCGSVADGASIHITTPAGQARCLDCEAVVEISACYEPCPLCGRHRLDICGGDRVILNYLEVE